MGLIRWSFSFLDIQETVHFFRMTPPLVRKPCVLRKHIIMLESEQERATKSVDLIMKNLDYTERLQKLPTLQFRRQVRKQFNSFDRATLSPSFRPITRVTRKYPFQLTRNRPKDGARAVQSNSFYYRIASSWNELDQNVAEAPTINSFIARIDAAWIDKANKFTITEPTQSYAKDEELFEEI